MRMFLLAALLGIGVAPSVAAQTADPHGWIGTERVKTRFGDLNSGTVIPKMRQR